MDAVARRALDRAARALGPRLDRLRTLEPAVAADQMGRESSVSSARRLHQ